MTDSDNNTKDQAPPAATEDAGTVASTGGGSPGKQSAGRTMTGVIAWLALLLALAMAGGAAWLWPQLQGEKAGLVKLDQRVQQLESYTGREQADLEAFEARWDGALDERLEALRASVASESSQLAGTLEEIGQQLAEQGAELGRFTAADRDSWLLAEAEYLLRLADQRLILAGDARSAVALLQSADEVLRQLDHAGLHDVRAAVAGDLAAVRAVPELDVEGIYLRLSALIEQAEQLVIFSLPEQEAQAQPEVAENWQGRLRQGYEQALVKLSDYIIIRRRDVPMRALMDPQWEGLVRQNLRMLLEQAQVALLSGNQSLYAESLGRARHWVEQFMASDAATAGAIDRELVQLSGLQVAVELPDISRSLQALDEAAKKRQQQRSGE